MKLTDEQWEEIGNKLTPRMSADDIKKILTDSSYEYDDEDIKDILAGVSPDDPDESSDKPHDEELAGETTPEEDFMQRAAAGEVPATSGVLAGDLTPEEVEMIQMMRAKKQASENTGNITNRLAKNLSKHRW